MRKVAIYILHCSSTCASVRSVSGTGPNLNRHALLEQPVVNCARFGIGCFAHLGIKCRLAQPFLEHAHGRQQFVGNDGVVHAHAAFIEHAQDRFVAPQLVGQFLAQLLRLSARKDFGIGSHMRAVMTIRSPFSHAVHPSRKKRSVKSTLHSVSKSLPALRSEALRLSRPTRPGQVATPIRHRQNGPFVMQQPGHQMLAVLPDRFDHHQRRVLGNGAEHLDAAFLAVDEAMLLGRVIFVPAPELMAPGA